MKKQLLTLILLIQVLFSYSQSPCVAPTGGPETVTEGGFENGAGGATFGGHVLYTLGSASNSSPGTYYIGNGVKANFNKYLTDVNPHSGNSMLMIDAKNPPDPVFYEQTVTVEAGKTYFFSVWIASLSDNERCNLEFLVKGNNDASFISLGSAVMAPTIAQGWIQVYTSWNSGTNTSATIQMVSKTPANSPNWGNNGNDFAIDDVSFKIGCPTPNNEPKPNFGSAVLSLCSNGGNVDLKTGLAANTNTQFTWYKENTLLNNFTTNNISVNTTGTYTVCVVSNTCLNQASVKVIDTLAIDLGPDQNLCNPPTVTLNTGIINASNYKITWKKNGTVLPNDTLPTLLVASAGTYIVNVADKTGGNCKDADTITITSKLPDPQNANFCSKTQTTANLSVSGTGKYKWWSASTGGISLGTGPTYLATGLIKDSTFYVEDTTAVPAVAGLLNDNSWAGTDKSTNNVASQNYLEFTATKNATLDTIAAKFNFNSGTAGNAIITLTDKTDGTKSKTINSPVVSPGTGEHYADVVINYPLIAGHNYSIAISGDTWGQNVRYYDINFFSYPKAYGPVTFTGAQANGVYPGLFNWRLSVPSDCGRTPVKAIDTCNCLTTPINPTLTGTGPSSFCAGKAISKPLTASVTIGTATYQYEFFRDNVSIQGPSLTNTYTASAEGTYKVLISDKNDTRCKSYTNPLSIKVAPLPVVTATPTNASCKGKKDATISLNASGTYTYKWNDASGSTSKNLTGIGAGTYTVKITEKSCDSSLTVTITEPDSLIIEKVSIIPAQCQKAVGSIEIFVKGGTPAYTYAWKNFSNTSNPLNNLKKGTYSVTVTDSKNCKITGQYIVKDTLCDIRIPDIITLNNDGVNDYFRIENIEQYPNTTLEIYNRWGNHINTIEKFEILNSWDVTNTSGKKVAEGVYYYILHLNNGEQRKGTISVVRD